MKPQLRYFSEEELLTVHNAALDILEDTGIHMALEEAKEIFKNAGASIEGDVVKIPRKIVDKALETVPKRDNFVLYGRQEKHDIKICEDAPVLAAMTMATQVIDIETGKKRSATNADLEDLTKMCEKLDNVAIASALVTPQDVPMETCDWYTWATSIKNTSKHITGGAVGKKGVQDAIRMASIAVGGEEEFKKRPFISFWVLTQPPLKMDPVLTIEVLIEASRQNVPAIISSGPILGLTCPVTLVGAAAQTHAEILAGIVLSQLVNEGAPVVYTSFVRGMDMKTSNVTMSSPEFAILKSCMAELGRYLNLPTRMPSMLRDAKILDAQAGFETGMVGLVGSLASDILEGMQFDMDMVVDYADLPFCNECMAQLRRMTSKLEINDNTLAMDVISEVGPGGSFLSTVHTAMNFKQELWTPNLTERRMWDGWENDGALDIREKSLNMARQMIEENKDLMLLDEETQKKIDQIAEEATVR